MVTVERQSVSVSVGGKTVHCAHEGVVGSLYADRCARNVHERVVVHTRKAWGSAYVLGAWSTHDLEGIALLSSTVCTSSEHEAPSWSNQGVTGLVLF
jgi:hypothetical protein